MGWEPRGSRNSNLGDAGLTLALVLDSLTAPRNMGTAIAASGCIGSSYRAEILRNARGDMSGLGVLFPKDRITILGLEGRRLRPAPFLLNSEI
jgi:hypothetical protein